MTSFFRDTLSANRSLIPRGNIWVECLYGQTRLLKVKSLIGTTIGLSADLYTTLETALGKVVDLHSDTVRSRLLSSMTQLDVTRLYQE